MLPLAEGEGGRYGLAGSKTAVVQGAEECVYLECVARMRTAQV